MLNSTRRRIWVVLSIILFLGVSLLLYIRISTYHNFEKVITDVSGSTFNTLLSAYQLNGFTEEEVYVLAGYVARSLSQMLFPDMTIRSVSIGNVKYASHSFEAYDIDVSLGEVLVTIDNMLYNGEIVEISYRVSEEPKTSILGQCRPGNICIAYIKEGKWYGGE